MEWVKGLARGFIYEEPHRGARGYRLFYNENLFLSDEYYAELARAAASVRPDELRLYSDPYCSELRARIAEFLGVSEDMVFVGNGVDSIISVLVDLALAAGGELVTVEPTFGMYRFKAEAKGCRVRTVLLNEDYTLNVEWLLAELGPRSIAVLCSPNNPTGNQFSLEDVRQLLDSFRGLVVVDETYAEYARYSLVGEVKARENLVVLRSFSKAWGLAGLRAGYGVAHPDVVKAFMRFIDPYPVSAVTKRVVMKALDLAPVVMEAVREAVSVREYMYREMQGIECVKPYPSDASFVFFKAADSRGLLRRLAEEGYLVRDVGDKPLCEGGLRVTVAPMPIARGFIDALSRACGGEA